VAAGRNGARAHASAFKVRLEGGGGGTHSWGGVHAPPPTHTLQIVANERDEWRLNGVISSVARSPTSATTHGMLAITLRPLATSTVGRCRLIRAD
jgi:hypothetical protein